MDKKVSILIKLVVSIFIVLISVGSGWAAEAKGSKDQITIGFSRSLTGIFAPQAEGEQHSVILWSELVNKKGGLAVKEYGKKLPVKLVYYDDKSSEEEVVRIYEKLITSDKVDILFPPSSTAMNKATIAIVERYKRPLVVATSGLTQDIRKIKPKYWRMVEPGVEDFMNDLAELIAAHKAEIKTVALITVHDAYLTACGRYLTPILKQKGFEIILDKDYPLGISDLSQLLSEVKDKKPDAFIALSNVADGILGLKQTQEVGLNVKFYYNCLLTALGPIFQMFGQATEGVTGQGNYSPKLAYPSVPTPKEFYDLYSARWNVPPDFLNSALGFQGAQVTEQAIEAAGTLNPEKLRAVLDSKEFMTICGPVKFKEGLNTLRTGGVIQFQKGIGELVSPMKAATAKLLIPKPAWPKP